MTDWIEYLDINNKYRNDKNKADIIKFMFMCMQCNEYCNIEYGRDISDAKKIKLLSDNIKLKFIYDDYKEMFIKSFSELKCDNNQRTYVKDMRYPDKPREYKYYNSRNDNLKNFLNVVYQIRCNLFHGEKEPTSEDITLISWAYDCLSQLLEGVID